MCSVSSSESGSLMDYSVDINKSIYQQQRNFVNKYEFVKQVCNGVFKCIEKSTGQMYAAKITNKLKAIKNEINIKLEIEILQHVNHPNIIKYKEHFETINNIIIITEFVGGKPIPEMMTITIFSESNIRFVMQRLLSAIEYMHNNHIVHRDIHPENIILMCDKEGNINNLKIWNFEHALHCINSIGIFYNDECGKANFSAPEIKYPRVYDRKVDVYSAGRVMLYMIPHRNIFKKSAGKMSKDILLKCSNQAKDIYQKLTESNPIERLSASEALNHDFLKQIN